MQRGHFPGEEVSPYMSWRIHPIVYLEGTKTPCLKHFRPSAVSCYRGLLHYAGFSLLVSEDKKSGRLIQLFDVMAKSGLEYFLAYSEARHNTPKIRAFRE
jgi:hypothetical protein